MRILIDRRPGSGDMLIPLSRAFPDSDVRHADMEFGDVAWQAHPSTSVPWVVAELKRTLSDIRDSVESGRLFGEQVHGLLRRYERGYLIVGASAYGDEHAGTWTNKTIVKVCQTFNALTGWPGLWVPTGDADVLETLVGMIEWWQEPINQHRAHLAIKEPMLERPGVATTTERVLAQLPSVGPTRARALAGSFRTVGEILAAGPEALEEVEGVGPKTARAIIGALTEPEERE